VAEHNDTIMVLNSIKYSTGIVTNIIHSLQYVHGNKLCWIIP
jgi:hypothetical protein